MGGCLFIDEATMLLPNWRPSVCRCQAYALADRGGDKFSGEVIRTLLTEVENHRTGLLAACLASPPC